jgi:spore coat polysaccharide biosynthesis predicted glycosyltransferase SpsG
MTSAVFRVDGSRRVGMGHVMRCLGFADGLGSVGVRSTFLVRDSNEISIVKRLIRSRGYHVATVPRGSSLQEDARFTVGLASECTLVVTDLCYAEMLEKPDDLSAFHTILKRNAKFVLTLDNGTGINYVSDVIVVPYYRTKPPQYTVDASQTVLVGPSYFIFRPEFIEAAKVPRKIRAIARNLLVTVSSSDAFNLTVKIAHAVVRLDPESVDVKFVIGAGFASAIRRELTGILRGWPGKSEVLIEPGNMGELMLWSDLAITGEGLTKYETAVTGAPSIMISQFDTHSELIREFEKAGTTLHLGAGHDLHEDDIVEAIVRVSKDMNLRRSMSRKGKAMVDGRGVERVIASLPRGVLS